MRPEKDQYFLEMAKLVSTRGTCLRRSVGCVLTNKFGHVLATGYNGVAAGMPHCNEIVYLWVDFKQLGKDPKVQTPTRKIETTPFACEGAKMLSGQGLDKCGAIHAEQNALLQCRDTQEIHTCYCTTAPCITCTKLLMNTSCGRIIFSEDYPHSGPASNLWYQKPGRCWIKKES